MNAVASELDVVCPAEEHVLRLQPSPHLSDRATTRRLMFDVLVALVPVLVAAVYFFGLTAVRVVVLSLIGCLGTEYIFNLIRKKPNSLFDCSATITAIILAFSLPPDLPAFAVILGSVAAIGIGKMLFGGLGQNVFNPAMVGRAFLMAAFPVLMTTWTVPADAVSQATPLAQIKPGDLSRALPAGIDLLIGNTGGSLGETSVVALLIGAVYLLVRRAIDVSIPFGILGAAVVFSGIAYWVAPGKFVNPMFHLGAGALVFGAFFIATDPVSSPLPKTGRWIYGAGIGVLTMLIRQFGTYPEGVMFSILTMNALAPLISRWTMPKPLGGNTFE
jgi:electron transport complex protein RnfD